MIGGLLAIAALIITMRVLMAGYGDSAKETAGSVSVLLSRANDRVVDVLTPRVSRALAWLGVHLTQSPPRRLEFPPDPPDTAKRRAPSRATPKDVSTAAPPTPPAPTTEPAALPAPAVVSAPAAPAAIDGSAAVYSSSDPGITPPIAINQQLRNPPEPGEQNVAAIDIVVDETGHVESATVVGYPGSLQAAMTATVNLSAVKAWRFQPALKSGQPVKYRRTVWVATR